MVVLAIVRVPLNICEYECKQLCFFDDYSMSVCRKLAVEKMGKKEQQFGS